MTENEADKAKNRFLSSLGKLDHDGTIEIHDIDSRKENMIFYFYAGFIVLLLIACVVMISLADPYYKRISGHWAEFILTFAIHSIVLTGILKSVRSEESVWKHILAGGASIMLAGSVNILTRLSVAGKKPFIWAIFPSLAKFSHFDDLPVLAIVLAFILPIVVQFGLLALLYQRERLSLLVPFVTYYLVANSITAFIMMTPLIGGV